MLLLALVQRGQKGVAVLRRGRRTPKQVTLLSDDVEGEKFKSDLCKSRVQKGLDTMRDRELLRNGNGVAIIPDALTGTLVAWEQKVIEITLYNNMPGLYQDDLLVDVAPSPARAHRPQGLVAPVA